MNYKMKKKRTRYEVWDILHYGKEDERAFKVLWGTDTLDTDFATSKEAFNALPRIKEKMKSIGDKFRIFKVDYMYTEVDE